MKRRTSQILVAPKEKMISSTKQISLLNTASDSLKAPNNKGTRKNRQFGDDITNLQKQPVFQQMQVEKVGTLQNQKASKTSQIAPYLSEIEAYVQQLDEQYNFSVMSKISTKSSDSTEVTLDMRRILVKWIIQVAQKFRACQETVHIAVQIIDYVLVFSNQKITKANFQLLGISALFLASKYNEIYTPEAKKYVYVCDGLYTLEQLFGMESYILTLTNFNLQFPTLNNFTGPLTNDSTLSQQFKKTVDSISKMVVLDFNLFNKYRKLHLCGVIVYLSAKLSNTDRFSPEQIMREMDMDQQTFKNCFSNLMTLYKQHVKPLLPNAHTKND